MEASLFASKFDGECLSLQAPAHISSFKGGLRSVKFKCEHGHVFYKPVNDLLPTPLTNCRKMSFQTAASSSDCNSSSSEEETDDSWCPKCQVFYRLCQKVARQSGFKLLGSQYGALSLRCRAGEHTIPISYSRRLSAAPMPCHQCVRQEREALKTQLRHEEAEKQSYYAHMQEQVFFKA